MAEENSEKKENRLNENKRRSFDYDSLHGLRRLAIYVLSLGLIGYFVRGTFWFFVVIFFIAIILLKGLWNGISPYLPEFLVKGIPLVVTLVIIGYMAFFVYRVASQGTEAGITSVVGTQIRESAIWKGAGVFLNKLNFYAENPLAAGDPFAQPASQEKISSKGISFDNPETRKNYYVEGETIIVEGDATITALENDDTSVNFGCNINQSGIDRDGTIKIVGILGNKFKVYAGYDETIHYICELEGIEFDDANESKDKKYKIFNVNIFGEYQDFTTTSLLSIYTLENQMLEQLKSEGKDPFGIGDYKNLNKKDGITAAECIKGCGLTRVALQSQKQPQTELTPYPLRIALKKDSDYYGDIIKIESITVDMPQGNFELIACENFGGDNAFDKNDPSWESYNKEFVESEYGDASEYAFYCDYKVTRPAVKPGIASDIKVDAVYDYRVVKLKTIEIRPGKQLTENDQETLPVQPEGDYEDYTEATYYDVG
mgnify:CR=1 FL=1